jgi:hypothetical protein
MPIVTPPPLEACTVSKKKMRLCAVTMEFAPRIDFGGFGFNVFLLVPGHQAHQNERHHRAHFHSTDAFIVVKIATPVPHRGVFGD